MFDRSNIIYKYDWTFNGVMCCVFECYLNKETPFSIETEDKEQETLFPMKFIKTDADRAKRVIKSIPNKISPHAYEIIRNVFISCHDQKELLILNFIQVGFINGSKVVNLTTDDHVHRIMKVDMSVKNEAHYHVEFLRFSKHDTFLASEITPKNSVLPLIVGHFCDRLPSENFMIYDKSHKAAFIHLESGDTEFIYNADITLPEICEEEQKYQLLWKHFYKTIAVPGRINHKLRMSNMPKRYWPNMTEFK